MCAARLDPLVCCVLADSPFASLPLLVHDLLDEKVGSVLVDAAMGVVSRSVAYRAGFKISDVRVDAVAPVCPILLVPVSTSTPSMRRLLAGVAVPHRSTEPGCTG